MFGHDGSRGIVVLSMGLWLGTLASLCGAATTIDFEQPSLRNDDRRVIDPYVSGGVRFTPEHGLGQVGLVKESALTSCASRGDNQLLGTGGGNCLIGQGDGPIIVQFLPEAGPVNVVSVDMQTGLYAHPALVLYGQSGQPVGFALGPQAISAYGTCNDLVGITRRSTVRAVASEAVAHAYIWKLDSVSCIPGLCACVPSAIDNFSFTYEPVPSPVAIVPSALWPPDRNLVPVQTLISLFCGVDEYPQAVLTSITSDEPDEGTGPNDLPGDIQGAEIDTADFDFSLRAERDERGDGRAYTACYEIRCPNGNVTRECATVVVPRDGRGETSHTTGAESVAQAVTATTAVTPGAPRLLEAAVAPYPGRGEATLAYGLPRAGPVRLTIYDLAGRRVACPLDGWRPAGRHHAELSAGARPGIYLYRLEWEGQAASGKFAMVR